MNIKALLHEIEWPNLRRLLDRKNIGYLVTGLKILMIVATLALVALGASRVNDSQVSVEQRLTDFSAKVDAAMILAKALPTPSGTGPDLSAIAKRSLFPSVGAATPSGAGDKKPVESNLPLSLIGVFLPDDDAPYAIIQDDKKNLQEVFSLKDQVFSVATLMAIYPDKVEIDRNGTREVLVIDNTASSKSSVDIKDGVGAVSETEFVVEEAELDKALENLPLLLTQARAVPYFKDGKAIGLRLFAIRSGSLFEKIGLQNGDVLKTVNGNSLADLSQAMQLFQKLKDERSISMNLERNMVEKEFKYQIK